MKGLDPRLRQVLLVGAAVAAFLALGAAWLWRFRRGQPVDIDEAGYLAIAVADYRGLVDGGPGGFWDAVMAPTIQAPLMTALTAPVFAVTGTGILPGLIVPLLLGGVMLLAVYGLGHELGGARVGWVAMTLTAATPVVIAYSRSYNFAIASGATTAVMLWAIARSRNFEQLGWSAGAGVAIGLVALSRTVTLAFLPSLIVVGLLVLAAGPRRGRRLGSLALAAAIALVVAGPWYRSNGDRVLDYLRSYGYGRASAAYGDDQSLLSAESWRQTTANALYAAALPMVLLWLLALLAVAGVWVLAWRRDGFRRTLRRSAASRLMPSLVWVGWCLCALTSTGNKGSAFITAVVPALAAVTAWAVWRLPPLAARTVTGAAIALLALNTAVSSLPGASWAQPRRVDLPWVGVAPVYRGESVIQEYVADARVERRGGRLPDREARAWHRAVERLTDEITELGPGVVYAVFGYRHKLANPNDVQLEQLLDGGPALLVFMVDPTEVPNDARAMTEWLSTGSAATACLVLTARGTSLEFEPLVDGELMAQAAREAGFVRRTTVELPDHRTVVVWRRPSSCPVTTS